MVRLREVFTLGVAMESSVDTTLATRSAPLARPTLRVATDTRKRRKNARGLGGTWLEVVKEERASESGGATRAVGGDHRATTPRTPSSSSSARAALSRVRVCSLLTRRAHGAQARGDTRRRADHIHRHGHGHRRACRQRKQPRTSRTNRHATSNR
jgi:hypothetical protein